MKVPSSKSIKKLFVDYHLFPVNHEITPFLIVGHPRSGSTHLMSLLQSHPEIVCMHELLKLDGGKSLFERYHLGNRKALLKQREEDIITFLNHAIFCKHPKGIHAVGFKALYPFPREHEAERSYRNNAWSYLAQKKELKVIFLNRNLLRSYLSWAIAMQTNVWRVYQNSPKKATPTLLKVNIDHMLNYIRNAINREREIRSQLRSLRKIEVDYDELSQYPDSTLQKITGFLGVKQVPLVSQLKRQNPKKTSEMISNFKEVSRILNSNNFGYLLEE